MITRQTAGGRRRRLQVPGPRQTLLHCAWASVVALAGGTVQAQDRGGAGLAVSGSFGVNIAANEVRSSPYGNGKQVQLEATPGLFISSGSGLIKGSASYTMGLVRRFGDDGASSQVQNALSAAFTANLVPERLMVDTTAGISQSSISALGRQQAEGSLRDNTNRAEVWSASVAPRLVGSFGNVARYQVRHEVSAVNTRHSVEGDSLGTATSVNIDSTGSRALVGWGLGATEGRSKFRFGRETKGGRRYASLSLTPDPELKFSLRGGDETTNVGANESFTQSNWGFGIRWQPNERTQASLDSDRRYFGRSHQLGLSHRLPSSSFTYSSVKDVSGSSAPGALLPSVTLYELYYNLFTSAEPDPALRDLKVREYLRSTGQDPTTTVGGGYINTGVSLTRRQQLGWTYAGRRLGLTLLAFSSDSSLLDNPQQVQDNGAISQHGYNATASWRLTPTASLSLIGSRTMTKASSTLASTDLKSLSLGWTDQLGRRASFSLSARYSVFNSLTDPYRETSLTASLNMRF